MEYIYNNIDKEPDMESIIESIEDSIIKSGLSLQNIVWKEKEQTLHITFSSELTSEEKESLDTIVNNNLESPKVYPFKLTGGYDDPSNLDINLFGLYKQKLFDDRGAMYCVNYYRNYDGQTYDDLVVKDEYNYVYSPADLAIKRTETITWYLTNGEVGHVKTFEKYYNLEEAMEERVQRRKNLINKAKLYALLNIQGYHEESGKPKIANSLYLFTLCAKEIDIYINSTWQPLLDFINTSNLDFLTDNIKQGLINIITYEGGN